MVLEIVVPAVLLVFGFDFFNGFHDAANAIATVVATKVLSPIRAVGLAAAGNFVGMVFITNAIAETVGKGIVDPGIFQGTDLAHAMAILLSGVVGAIAWDVITWAWALPTSSSHALVGGLFGAALLSSGPTAIFAPDPDKLVLFFEATGVAFAIGAAVTAAATSRGGRRPTAGLVLLGGAFAGLVPAAILGRSLLRGVTQIVVFMVVAPLIGLTVAFVFAIALMHVARGQSPARVNHEFRRLQLISSFFYSVTHGTNDAQKGMGLITLILLVALIPPPWGPNPAVFNVPFWVIVGAHASISLGTLFGGWRIVRTMSQRVTRLRPFEGFSAETGGGLALMGAALAGIPVSTTHVISSAIMGVGATHRLSAVRWGVARRIVWAWVLTIPASAAMAAGTYAVVRFFL